MALSSVAGIGDLCLSALPSPAPLISLIFVDLVKDPAPNLSHFPFYFYLELYSS